jgi:hypothetical protein
MRIVIFVFGYLLFIGCKKMEVVVTPPPVVVVPEEAIKFSTNIDTGTYYASDTLPIVITVSSKIPSAGIIYSITTTWTDSSKQIFKLDTTLSASSLSLNIPGLTNLSESSLASNDTFAIYNTSTAAHEEATLLSLANLVGSELGINPINGVIYSASTWTDNSNGTITLPTVNVVLYNDQYWSGTAANYTVTGGTTGTGITGLTDDAINYIYIDYNSGTPQWVVTTSEPDYNRSDRAKYLTIYRLGLFLHILCFTLNYKHLKHMKSVKNQLTIRYLNESF